LLLSIHTLTFSAILSDMPEDMFYEHVLERCIRKGVLSPTDHTILVVAGAERDREAFLHHGFKHVTISNLDTSMYAADRAPYAWSRQDCENLTFPDGSFDFCVVHSGLHHCASPHRAMLEMLRVARFGILLFEPYDNFITRLGVRLGIGQEFEHNAVFSHNCQAGGMNHSPVANFIYRFTRREIRKTVTCAGPYGPYRFDFIHRIRIPWKQLKERKSKLALIAALAGVPLIWLISLIAPSQANCFAAVVLKPKLPEEMHPWLVGGDGKITANADWINARYQSR
jgi:SAM-dependent methyltransferase